jgi:hypothetical protein
MLALELAGFWLSPGLWGGGKANLSLSLTFIPPSASGIVGTGRNTGQQSIVCNGNPYFENLQSVPTSKTALSLGGVTTLGYCLLHNADNSNYISVFGDNAGGAELVRLLPGDYQLLRFPPSGTPFVQSNTAACNLEIFLIPS